jgi:hypothetical protein
MRNLALLAAVLISIAAPAFAQQKTASHASRDQAIHLLRREGILHGATRVDSTNWNGQFWIISLRHAGGKTTSWTVDAKAEHYSYVH